MSELSYRVSAYAAIARTNALTTLAYRADFFVQLAGLLIQIFLLRMVWTAVYSGAPSQVVNGVDLSTMIAYTTLATIQYWLFNPWNFSTIPQRVREGKIAIDLSRPVRFLGQVLAGQCGITAAMAPFALVAVPFGILVGTAKAPDSVGAGFGYVLTLIFSYVITILMSSIVGMMAFWTLEIGGALVPLWFMPSWLHAIASALPFQAATYTPLAVYLGRASLLPSLGVQLLWIVVLWLVLRLIWSRALHRVVVQGG